MMRIESHTTGDYKADSASVSTGDEVLGNCLRYGAANTA